MQWLSENWVFLLISIAFVAMHLFGHGGHGGHGRRNDEESSAGKDRERQAPRSHRH